jgi:hypothetical protein
MPQDTAEPGPLSVHYAFLVYLRAESHVTHRRVAGRVEHVVSGQARHFSSLEDLLAFMTQVLANVRAPPRRAS